MCMIIFAHDWHPGYQLIVTANRDEFYKRPDQTAAFWPEHPLMLAGKDLHQGGTWTGITKTGKFAALTNYRDPASMKKEAPSRGKLVENYLTSYYSPAEFIAKLENGGAAYNGFNLLFGSIGDLYYYSNREKQLQRIGQGIHGLSNSLLDVPWPKVSKAVKEVGALADKPVIEAEQLFAIMADQTLPADDELPQTGVGIDFERVLAPAFVASESYGYGTKLTTVILVDRDQHVRFWERSFKHGNTEDFTEVYYSFQIQNDICQF